MVCHPPKYEIALLGATDSLVDQIISWAAERQDTGVVLVPSPRALANCAALARAALAVVDGTRHVGQAMDIVDAVLAQTGAGNLAFYTEVADAGAEVFIRTRGLLYLLGPLSRPEWNEVLDATNRRRLAAAAGPMRLAPSKARTEFAAGFNHTSSPAPTEGPDAR